MLNITNQQTNIEMNLNLKLIDIDYLAIFRFDQT